MANLLFSHIKKNILIEIKQEVLEGSIKFIKEEEEAIRGHLGFDITSYMRG